MAQETKPSSTSETTSKTTTTTMQSSGKATMPMQSSGKAPTPLDKLIKVQEPNTSGEKSNSATTGTTVSSTIIADINSLNLADPKHTAISSQASTTAMQTSGKATTTMQSLGKAPTPLDKLIKVQEPLNSSNNNKDIGVGKSSSTTTGTTVSSKTIAEINSLNLADPKHTPLVVSTSPVMQSVHNTKDNTNTNTNKPTVDVDVVDVMDLLIQKNLDKASKFEAKASKLSEKALATSTYPAAQVNKFTEKAASEELKAEQYRAGALLTAQESSLPGGGGVFTGGVSMQTMDKGQGQGKGQGQVKGQGPPPPMQNSAVSSNSNSNTANSNVGKENLMLAGRPEPLSSSPPATTSAMTTVTATTSSMIPIVPLSGIGGGSAPGLGASQAGRVQELDAPKQGLASVMQSSSKAPLPNILMDGNNQNKQSQATLMQTSLKVIHPTKSI